ncbi:MAG: hypothetical protein JNM63_17920 [Spirochaetia bacterium]|nr:hypothetical protein [Spirochaetia bacterium]
MHASLGSNFFYNNTVYLDPSGEEAQCMVSLRGEGVENTFFQNNFFVGVSVTLLESPVRSDLRNRFSGNVLWGLGGRIEVYWGHERFHDLDSWAREVLKGGSASWAEVYTPVFPKAGSGGTIYRGQIDQFNLEELRKIYSPRSKEKTSTRGVPAPGLLSLRDASVWAGVYSP